MKPEDKDPDFISNIYDIQAIARKQYKKELQRWVVRGILTVVFIVFFTFLFLDISEAHIYHGETRYTN